eukprot:scaffold53687_cov52-Phaeocystis_antarctica.AAC.2
MISAAFHDPDRKYTLGAGLTSSSGHAAARLSQSRANQCGHRRLGARAGGRVAARHRQEEPQQVGNIPSTRFFVVALVVY